MPDNQQKRYHSGAPQSPPSDDRQSARRALRFFMIIRPDQEKSTKKPLALFVYPACPVGPEDRTGVANVPHSSLPPLSIRKIEKIVFENQLLLMGKYNESQDR